VSTRNRVERVRENSPIVVVSNEHGYCDAVTASHGPPPLGPSTMGKFS
jgi:hypothetical protein